jgi:hypothetical protein
MRIKHEFIILGRNKLVDSDRIPFLMSQVPRVAAWGCQKERDGVFLTFGVAGLSLGGLRDGLLAQW